MLQYLFPTMLTARGWPTVMPERENPPSFSVQTPGNIRSKKNLVFIIHNSN